MSFLDLRVMRREVWIQTVMERDVSAFAPLTHGVQATAAVTWMDVLCRFDLSCTSAHMSISASSQREVVSNDDG